MKIWTVTALIASFRVITVASPVVSRVSTFLTSPAISLLHLVPQLLPKGLSSLNLTAIHHQLLPKILMLLKDIILTGFHLLLQLSTLAVSKAVPFLTSLQYHHVKSPVAFKDIAFHITTTAPTLHHRQAQAQAPLSWGTHQPCLRRRQQSYLRDSIIFTMIQVQCKLPHTVLPLILVLPVFRRIFFQHLMGPCGSHGVVIQRLIQRIQLSTKSSTQFADAARSLSVNAAMPSLSKLAKS